MTKVKRSQAVGLLAVLIGCLAIFSCARFGFDAGGAEDDDRPPIIVKGGSLIFQSGDPGGEEDEKQGKPWKQVGGDYQPQHDNGKKTKWFVIAIQGGAGCPVLSMTKELSITYVENGVETTFTMLMKERGSGRTKAPTIVGASLNRGGTEQNPQLIFGTAGRGSIKDVSFSPQGGGTVTCNGPSQLKIWQF